MIAKANSMQTPFKTVLLVCLTMLLSLGVVTFLVGCSNNSDEQRIAELEAEVERLQNNQSASDATTDNQTANDATQNQNAQSKTTFDNATIQEFSDRANDLISQAEAAEVPSDRNARIDGYFKFDSEFNALELEMDTYEDQQEAQYRSGSLSWEDYRSIELQLEQIENNLDTAQDKLEIRFGIND